MLGSVGRTGIRRVQRGAHNKAIGRSGDQSQSHAELEAADVEAVISLTRRTEEIAWDAKAYGLRYLIECLIDKIKHTAELRLVNK